MTKAWSTNVIDDHYTVVAQYETEEQAEHAYHEVREQASLSFTNLNTSDTSVTIKNDSFGLDDDEDLTDILTDEYRAVVDILEQCAGYVDHELS